MVRPAREDPGADRTRNRLTRVALDRSAQLEGGKRRRRRPRSLEPGHRRIERDLIEIGEEEQAIEAICRRCDPFRRFHPDRLQQGLGVCASIGDVR